MAAASELEGLRAEAALAPPVPVFAEDRPDLAHLYDKLDAAIQGSELRIEELSLVGRIALARGDLAAATMSFRNAVEVQDHGQYSEPPPWLYPVRETLAAALVRAGANEEAIEVLTECLRRTPHDPRATLALHQLLLATGRTHEARSLEPEIAAAQARAEQPLAALEF